MSAPRARPVPAQVAPARPAVRAASAAAAVVLLAVVAAVAARSVFAGAYGSGPYSFPHQPHVSPATITAGLAEAAALDRTGRRPGGGGTVDKECRVCHDYAKGDEAHLTGCPECHVDGKHMEVDVAPSTAPAGAPRFPHKEHLKDPSVTCFSCHRVRKELGWIEFTLPEGGLGALGTGGRPGGKNGEFTCTDCHRTHEPKGGLVKTDEVTGDGRRCEECHAGAKAIDPKRFRGATARGADARGDDRSFLHADHGGGDAECERCHGAVRKSRTIWDYDPTAGTAEACATCHVDAEKKPLVGVGSPPRTTRPTFVQFSRFPHDRHLAEPEGKIETSGKVTDGCRTCHYPERDAAASKLFPGRKSSPEPIGRGPLVDYDSCMPCHEAWRVEGHGFGAWACFKCHTGAADAQGKLPTAKAKVERESLARGVKFERHAHPGVAREGAALADATQPGGPTGKLECRDCHLGDVAAVASRLGGKLFAHAPHLPGAPTNADCLACHTSSALASWSADLRRFDPHFEAPPVQPSIGGPQPVRVKGCLACHVGATREQVGVIVEARVVPEFDHKAHVTGAKWKGAVGVPCGECHVEGGEHGKTTPADVGDCTRCHSHDEKQAEKYARTGKKTSSEEDGKDCRFCHEEIRETLTPERIPPRNHLSLLKGTQHHDKGGDCASCHGREGRPYAYAERVRKAKVATSIHEDPALGREWYNDPAIAKAGADQKGRTCMTCHRAEPRGYLRRLGSR